MLKYSIILIFALVSFYSVNAQQDVIYSQYMFDKMLVNPAYAGSSKWVVGSVKNRMQFVNLEGAPTTNLFTFQAPVQIKNIGLGVKVVYDKIAVTNNLAATGFFSYHLGFGNGKLSFGLEGGIFNSSYNYNSLNRYDAIIDPSIAPGAESIILPDISTGVFYQSASMYFGASAYHLLSSLDSNPGMANYNFKPLSKSYYAICGYMVELSKNMDVEPGFLLKYVPASPVQVDLNLCFILYQRFSIGTSYRTGDAVIGFAKIDVTKNLKILYSYDFTLSHLSRVSNGSHEIGISYGIELLPPPEQKVIHPRYYF